MTTTISKKLSANDIGINGAHQAGILVPKAKDILSFFPDLNAAIKNPRMTLLVRELADGSKWEFNFIYYNNALFGGTRNEYRLTCMTKYLRAIDAKVGDDLTFSKDENGSIFVDHIRANSTSAKLNDDGVLVLSGGWKIINS
jgi:Restriction endonuclease EcoRII, N-terminal